MRREHGADVTQLLGAKPRTERVLVEVLPVLEAAVTVDGLGHPRVLSVAPVELCRLDAGPAARWPVTAEAVRRRLQDDVRAVLARASQARRGQRRGHHER